MAHAPTRPEALGYVLSKFRDAPNVGRICPGESQAQRETLSDLTRRLLRGHSSVPGASRGSFGG